MLHVSEWLSSKLLVRRELAQREANVALKVDSCLAQLRDQRGGAAQRLKQLQQMQNECYSPVVVLEKQAQLEAQHAFLRSSGQGLDSVKHRLSLLASSTAAAQSAQRAQSNRELRLMLRREVRRMPHGGSLPVFSKRAELIEKLEFSSAVVVTAHTGSGKSTQIPQFLVDDMHRFSTPRGTHPRVVCTQPRRMAARNLARRVHKEFVGPDHKLEDGNREVGYRVGEPRNSAAASEHGTLSKVVSDSTLIEYVTEGILVQDLKKDPSLRKFDAVLVDEAHERGKDTDMLMYLLRKHLLDNPSSGLKVLIMSASIDAERFAKYFGGCPIVECEGTSYTIDTRYLPLPGGSA